MPPGLRSIPRAQLDRLEHRDRLRLGAGAWTIISAPRPPVPGARVGGPGNARRLADRPDDPDQLEKWLAEHPNDAEGWYRLGAARQLDGRGEDAARAWSSGSLAMTRQPANVERFAWNRYWVGWCLSRLHQDDDARAAWAQSVEAFESLASGGGGQRDPGARATDLYNLACARNLAGNAKLALSTLREAIAAGWNDAAHATSDPDWQSLRDDPRFEEALKPIGGLQYIYRGG